MCSVCARFAQPERSGPLSHPSQPGPHSAILYERHFGMGEGQILGNPPTDQHPPGVSGVCALSVTPRCPHVPGPRGRELPGCWWGPGPGGPYPWEGPWALSPAPGPGYSGSPESGSPPPPRLWPFPHRLIHWCLLTSDPPAGALSPPGRGRGGSWWGWSARSGMCAEPAHTARGPLV